MPECDVSDKYDAWLLMLAMGLVSDKLSPTSRNIPWEETNGSWTKNLGSRESGEAWLLKHYWKLVNRLQNDVDLA